VKLDARNVSELRAVLHALEPGVADGAIVSNDLVYRLDRVEKRASHTQSQTPRDISLPAIPQRRRVDVVWAGPEGCGTQVRSALASAQIPKTPAAAANR
jgi:hypothetical protein